MRRWSARLVYAGSFLLSFQGGLLRVALPGIRDDVGASVGDVQAVSLAGLMIVTATLVGVGRFADLVGPMRIYAGGLVAFAIGAVGSASVPSIEWLVGAQAMQGVGWSMCIGSGPALLAGVFGEDERGRRLAGQHMAIALGLAAGPVLGGLLVEYAGWRWAFAALAPPALVLAALTPVRLGGGSRAGVGRFDWGGALLLAATLVPVVVLVQTGEGSGGGVALGGLLATSSLFALAGFVRHEFRSPDPIIDLRLFRDRRFSAGLAASFLNFVAMASNMFLLPFFLQDLLGLSTAGAGAVMIVVPAAILAAAPCAAVVARRVGPRLPTTAGLGALTVAVAAMATFDETSPPVAVGAVLVLYGVGAGFFQSPNTTSVLNAAPASGVGTAAGTLATVARLGQMVGVAVASGVWRAGLTRYGEGPLGQQLAFRNAFLVLAVFGALATAASWARGSPPVSAVPESRRR